MHFTIERSIMSMALARAARVIGKGTDGPIGHVLLEQLADRLTIVAMNAAVIMDVSVATGLVEMGAALVPVHKLSSAVSAMPDKEISVESEGLGLVVKHGRRKVAVQGLPPHSYPQTPAPMVPLHSEDLPANVLLDLFKQTSHAMGDSAERMRTYGLCVSRENGTLLAMATDGQRGAMATAPSDGREFCVFLLRPAVEEVAGWKGDTVTIRRDAERVEMRCSNACISWCNANDNPLDLRPLFSDVPKDVVSVVRTELLEATRAVTRVGKDDETSTGRIRMQTKDNEMTLTADADGCKASDTVNCKTELGSPTGEWIGLNGLYLDDALKACGSGLMRLSFTSPLHPVRIESGSYQACIMPIRLEAAT